jgi:hypothetical protein
MKIKGFDEKENLFLQSPMSNVYCLKSVFQWKPLPASLERRAKKIESGRFFRGYTPTKECSERRQFFKWRPLPTSPEI